MEISELITLVRSKKELSGISDSVVREYIDKHIKGAEALQRLSGKDVKALVSSVRADLRRISGRFAAGAASVSERSDVYPRLRQMLTSLHVHSVLDLGCGLNPLNLVQPGMKYYAYDINEANLAEVRKYFKDNNIDGEARVYDLINDTLEFPSVDITLFMKVFDVLEKKGHKLAERLIRRTNSRLLLISFPTKTLSGAPMRHPQRGWAELLLHRLGFSFNTFSSKNELFYLAKKDMNTG